MHTARLCLVQRFFSTKYIRYGCSCFRGLVRGSETKCHRLSSSSGTERIGHSRGAKTDKSKLKIDMEFRERFSSALDNAFKPPAKNSTVFFFDICVSSLFTYLK